MAWAAIPATLTLDNPLSSYNRRPVEIDFLVSTKLNFAHVKFLLELAIEPRMSNPSIELLRTSAEMLSLVVEAIVLKQRLANSGTSLVWKVRYFHTCNDPLVDFKIQMACFRLLLQVSPILSQVVLCITQRLYSLHDVTQKLAEEESNNPQVAYYGLAAAGVLCLALLYNTFDRAAPDVTPSKSIRDLSVLVAEIETGTLLQAEEPNYALLSAAARTIKNVMDRLISNWFAAPTDPQPSINAAEQYPLQLNDNALTSWEMHGLQDFDPEFWLNLSEHPFLTTPEGQP